MSLFAYNCDYDNFIKHYNIDSHNSYTNGCVCRGVVFSLDFCKSILKSDLNFPDFVYKVCYSKLIMNNIIEIEQIKKYKPFCIWYPELPSKDTCLILCNIDKDLNYSLSIVSILMNWKDVWENAGKLKDNFLFELCKKCNRNWNTFSETSLINIRYEEISRVFNNYSADYLFRFNTDMCKNVFTFYDYDSYEYSYPLGLSSLYELGFENHVINMNNPLYIYDDKSEPNLEMSCEY